MGSLFTCILVDERRPQVLTPCNQNLLDSPDLFCCTCKGKCTGESMKWYISMSHQKCEWRNAQQQPWQGCCVLLLITIYTLYWGAFSFSFPESVSRRKPRTGRASLLLSAEALEHTKGAADHLATPPWPPLPHPPSRNPPSSRRYAETARCGGGTRTRRGGFGVPS